MQKIKELWQNLSGKTKRLLIVITGVAIAVIAIGIFILMAGRKTEYGALFTGLSQEEAQKVVQLISDQSVQYQYDANSGTIRVPQEQVDTLRASLLSQGYPKSGFTYDMYINNAGLMTTESDKQQYTMYDLQDRLGATIRLFDGVQDAKVTIAAGQQSDFALDDESNVDASASVVVTMLPNATLTDKTAEAIKNLIARSVNGMSFSNVSVFDAGTMQEIGGTGEGDMATGNDLNDLQTTIQNSIATNVKKVLAKIYGIDNVEVSVKGTLDSSHLVSENIQYSVPEKIDEEDKTGLLHTEEAQMQNSSSSSDGAGGVAGTDANAEEPRYTVQTGANGDGEYYNSNATTREWLFNQLTEQRETNPGTLQDLTVAAVIDTKDLDSISQNDLVNLVADAAGIARDDAQDKITIVRADLTGDVPEVVTEEPTNWIEELPLPLPILIAIGAFLLLVIFMILLIITKNNKKKKSKKKQIEEMRKAAEQKELEAEEAAAAKRLAEAEAAMPSEEEMSTNEHVKHSMKLKEDIGGFVDQNPQVAAKLIQGWLHEEEEAGGKRR